MALQRVSNLLDHFVAQQPQYARLLGSRQQQQPPAPRQGPSHEELLTAGLLSGLSGERQRQLLRGGMGGSGMGHRVRNMHVLSLCHCVIHDMVLHAMQPPA